MILGVLDALVVFSGLPTGWKKGVVLAASIALIFIGWIIRTIEKRRAMRAKARAQTIETDGIAHDVIEKVEHEIAELEHHHNHGHESEL